MAMPGKPAAPMGAEGQINVPGSFIEPAEPHDAPPEDGDDRVDVPVGQQQQGPNSPTHGAAGGFDVNFTEVAPDLFTPSQTTTGLSLEHHPAAGNPIP